jgi:hypothetical protein
MKHGQAHLGTPNILKCLQGSPDPWIATKAEGGGGAGMSNQGTGNLQQDWLSLRNLESAYHITQRQQTSPDGNFST